MEDEIVIIQGTKRTPDGHFQNVEVELKLGLSGKIKSAKIRRPEGNPVTVPQACAGGTHVG